VSGPGLLLLPPLLLLWLWHAVPVNVAGRTLCKLAS
jgi:hypothetical protein